MPVCAEECKEELSPAIEGVGPVLNEIGAVYEWEHFTESRLSNNYAQCILAQLFGVHVEFASLLNKNAGQRKQLIAGLAFKLGLHDLEPVQPVPPRQGKQVTHPRPHVGFHAYQIVRDRHGSLLGDADGDGDGNAGSGLPPLPPALPSMQLPSPPPPPPPPALPPSLPPRESPLIPAATADASFPLWPPASACRPSSAA